MMHQPIAETENRYVAEVTILPGCRAWGNTPAEALDNLHSVAGEFILSFKEHGNTLPKSVEETAYEVVGPSVSTEVAVFL